MNNLRKLSTINIHMIKSQLPKKKSFYSKLLFSYEFFHNIKHFKILLTLKSL